MQNPSSLSELTEMNVTFPVSEGESSDSEDLPEVPRCFLSCLLGTSRSLKIGMKLHNVS